MHWRCSRMKQFPALYSWRSNGILPANLHQSTQSAKNPIFARANASIMKILHTDIYKFSIPMHPFTIATGTMHYAQNILIRVHTDAGYYGVGECSAFPMIVGETQATCFEMAKDFAQLWKGKEAADIE